MKIKLIFYQIVFLFAILSIVYCKNEKLDNATNLASLSILQRLGGSIIPAYINTPSPSATTISLTAIGESTSVIMLAWTALPSTVNYRVYRDVTAGFTPSATNEVVSDAATSTTVTLKTPKANLTTPLNPTVTSARNNKGLTAQTKYYYKIAGLMANGVTVYSNEASAVATSGVSVATHAGSGVQGNANGDGPQASFTFPQGLSVDANGFIYLADAGNQLIRKISPRIGDVSNAGGAAYAIEGQATTFAGTGSWGNANSTTPTTASFFDPWSTCVDSGTENIYVADSTNHSIRQITTAGVVTTLAGANTAASGKGSTDGTGTAALFYYPQAIACDGTNVFVADTYNNLIRQIVIATKAVTTVAGTAGTAGQGNTDGTGAAARFYLPKGIVVGGANLYVSDSGNHTIRQIVIATGVVTTLAGAVGVQGKADGVGTAATFSFPRGITSDGGTNLYVADSSNNLIRKIVIATGTVTTIAGTGLKGSLDGVGTNASFWDPQGITYAPKVTSTDGCPCLYVSDTTNHKIRRITGL